MARMIGRLHALQASLAQRTGGAVGLQGPAGVLAETLQVPVEFIEIVRAHIAGSGQHRVVDILGLRVRLHEAEAAHDADDMGVDHEGALAQRAEIQGSGGDLAADAADLLQPDQRRFHIQPGQEFQIEGAGTRADVQQRILQLAGLFVGELDAFQSGLDIGHRSPCQRLRAAVAVQEAGEDPVGLPVHGAARNEAADELVDRADAHAGTVPPESDAQTVPDGPEVGRLAKEEVRLHVETIEQKRNSFKPPKWHC